jgi:FAD dependent oxidoreductase/NADH:flavin oxidoreductase / NADH oxidase family
LHESSLFDFVNISGITYHTFHFLAAPMTAQKDAHFVPNAVRAKQVVNGEIPVLVASVIKEIDRAAQVVGDGEADMVGMVRAHIADPDLVRKAQEGRSGEIRRCVGANQGCIRRYIGRNGITCTVNPAVGRERQYGGAQDSTTNEPRSVLVIGGGPAGLKAAESAARRGHSVTLVERQTELGGSLRLMARLPDRERWLDLADDLTRSLERLGVDVRLGEDVTPAAVLEVGADVNIVATGARHDKTGWSMSMPGRSGIPGAEQEHVLAATEAIRNSESVGASVIIVDDNGDHLPHGLALMLAQGGRKVEIISSQFYASTGLVTTNDLGWVYPKLVESGVKVNSSTYVERIGTATVDVCGIWGDGQRTIDAETVVLCMTRSSNDSLYHELVDAGANVKRIGDCVAPREVDDAVYEGEKAGRAV